MPINCLVLPYATADGPANMALDEAMLEAAAGGVDAYLRFYGWTVPTLSLGYFQRIAEFRSDPRWRDAPLVRRPTGGGAIWHHHELTYAIAIPPGFPLARPNTALYRAVHGEIAGLLNELGIPARRQGEAPSVWHAGNERPPLCFTGREPEDIVSERHKLVGSAQRRRGGAILQHGSILLVRSPRVPELSGVCDVADVPTSTTYWEEHLETRIPAALGLQARAAGFPPGLRGRADDLEWSTYRTREWTESR